MSRPRPLMRAEQLALDEGVESQDSQAILDALKAEFGAAAPGTACEDVDVSAGRGADEREERHGDNGAEAGDLDIPSSARRSVRWQNNSFKVGIALCFAVAVSYEERYAEAD
ncbi:hypothetical protein ACHAPE_001828 [Trichoderma viride]